MNVLYRNLPPLCDSREGEKKGVSTCVKKKQRGGKEVGEYLLSKDTEK